MRHTRRQIEDIRYDQAVQDEIANHLGLLEPDQPTITSTEASRRTWIKRLYGDFTAEERAEIRSKLDVGLRSVEEGKTEGAER